MLASGRFSIRGAASDVLMWLGINFLRAATKLSGRKVCVVEWDLVDFMSLQAKLGSLISEANSLASPPENTTTKWMH